MPSWKGRTILNWIRLEPETKAFQYALKKRCTKNIDLLPNDENDLKICSTAIHR